MSLLRHTARRSLNVVMTHNIPVVARLPLFARVISSNASLFKENDLMKHAPGWKHENASDSEASIKADREPQPKNVEDLQKETVEHLKQDGSNTTGDLKNKAEALSEDLSKQAKEYANKAKAAGENLVEQSKEYAQKAKVEGEKMTENMPGMEAKEYAKKARDMGEDASKQGLEYAEKAKEEAQRTGESVVDGVKSGAEKMSQFVKESVDSAKKAVGMDK
ncbi:hypothetical protein EDD21DRAFT_391099 [Dissophora ornata]|nr:hypothetical protein EDD21DRAFT_391099 [Dissophora ornata]